MLKTNFSKVLIASIISLSGLISISKNAYAEINPESTTFQIASKKDKKAKSKIDTTKVATVESSDKKLKADKSSVKKTVKAAKLINVNTASETDLHKLPGIGDKLAKNIVAYRTQHGKFKDINELKKVDGIGDLTIEKLKSAVKF